MKVAKTIHLKCLVDRNMLGSLRGFREIIRCLRIEVIEVLH